jgi:hypothetical protein
MVLRKLSDLALLVLLAAAGSLLRPPVWRQTGAPAPVITPAKTPANGVSALRQSLREPAGRRASKPAVWFEAPLSMEPINSDSTWRNA